jgi:hypothetical protein
MEKKLKTLLEEIAILRDAANIAKEKWYNNRDITYGDGEEVATDVEFGRVTAFNQCIQLIVKMGLDKFYSKQTVIKVMEEYAQQKKTGWVSVEERLPEQESRVLFCLKGGAMIAGYFFENHFYSGDSYCFKTVTHWQPLPEPPKK